jgi:hypothetical protein
MRHWLIILPFILSACKPEPKVSTYEVKSENTPVVAKANSDSDKTSNTMNSNAALQAEVASFSEPKWGSIPKSWIAAAPNPMRKGSWTVTSSDGSKAEIAITVFPGDVGGDAANVNRWRGQLGLEKISEDKIKSSQNPLSAGNLTGRVYELTSADAKKSTVAVIVPKDNATWFFKLTGDTTIVNSEKESFLKMVAGTQLP